MPENHQYRPEADVNQGHPNGPSTPALTAPGSGRHSNRNRSVQSGRSDLVLFLGILSLFMCGPLGIVAWVMANAELKKIRAGEASPQKIGVVKAGRVLGILGTAIFVAVLIAAATLVPRWIAATGGLLKSTPLLSDQINFVGEWFGKNGTLIRIRPDGRGDFKTSSSTVTGGRVRIEGESLSIGMLGLFKTWHVDTPPGIVDGAWTMTLDGEVFVKQSHDLTVQAPGRVPMKTRVRGETFLEKGPPPAPPVLKLSIYWRLLSVAA